MASIYPPQGPQNQARAHALKRDERAYLLFSLEFADAVLASRPFHTEALEMAANHMTELGYFDDGLLLDERLAELHPGDPGILYNLACSLALTGRRDDAIRVLERAAEKGYRDSRHMAADEDLSSLREDPRFTRLVAHLAATAE